MKFSKFSELVNRILSNNHSHRRDMDVTIVVYSPGSIGSTPSVEVQSIHAGFDWDSGKVLIFPAQPLTTLTPEQITDITDSVRKGQSWHAYQEYKKHKEQLEKLSIELDAAKQRIAELEGNCAALAAENAGIKSAIPESRDIEDDNDNMDDVSLAEDFGFNHAIELMRRRIPETPATDAFLAEVRAEARNEGINYTASRLAAAFNHGFINKSLREVFDVTRMILSAKEELANEPHPLDGLSGEYAEKSLEEWAEQIRKGSSQ
ncbi:TPA: ead/Ea22-like family protein [Escherichia coli]